MQWAWVCTIMLLTIHYGPYFNLTIPHGEGIPFPQPGLFFIPVGRAFGNQYPGFDFRIDHSTYVLYIWPNYSSYIWPD